MTIVPGFMTRSGAFVTERTPRAKPTVDEFFAALKMNAVEVRQFWTYLDVLRLRGMGLTASVVVAAIALDRGQEEISSALRNSTRRVRGHWQDAKERFSLRGYCGLIRFLADHSVSWPRRRFIPTAAEQPFAMPLPHADADAPPPRAG